MSKGRSSMKPTSRFRARLGTIRGNDFALHRSEATMVIPPGAWDLPPLVPVVGIRVFGFVLVLRSPVFSARAERIRSTASGSESDLMPLQEPRQDPAEPNWRWLELEARQDCTKQIVSAGRQQLPPPRETTPV
jgi:hypothetical protein